MTDEPNIVMDWHTCFGKPRIRGTRLYTKCVYELVKHDGIAEFLKDHPYVTEEQIHDAIEHYEMYGDIRKLRSGKVLRDPPDPF